jgi:hypothetical protein
MKKMVSAKFSFGESSIKYSRVFLLFLWMVFSLHNQIRAQDVRDSSGVSVPEGAKESKPAGSFRDRLVPGGNFGFNIGNTWFIDLSPSLGYQVNDRLVSGAGISYVAYGTKVMNVNLKWERYGGMVFGRYRLLDAIFANAEMEMLNVEDETLGKRVWIVNPLVGASYIMPFGKRGGLQASLLYNLNYNPALSPYPSPVIWRLGFFL